MVTMTGRSPARVALAAWRWSWLRVCMCANMCANMCVCLCVSALLLGGCGPGVGGTGTGDTMDGLNVFGASAVSVCASDLAAVLACSSATGGGGGGAVAAPAPGTAPVYLADTIDGQRVAVSVQGNAIEVNAPCARVQFRGQWGVIAGQAARFYGTTGQDASSTLTPASLQAVVRGNGLELTLTDTQGRVLLGPVLVTVRPAPTVPGACG